MEAFSQWFSQLEWGKLIEAVISAGACLLCIVIHELCHGLAALWMGDDTARRSGRLTMNPLKHVDLVGLVLLITVHFGWAKPVPVNMRKFRRPKLGMVLTSLAGPLGNFIIALFMTPAYAASLVWFQISGSFAVYYLAVFLLMSITVSIGLMVFNLIPIPPLDGSKVLFSVLPSQWYRKLMRYERYGMIVLVVLLYLGVLDIPLSSLRNGIQQFIFTLAGDPVVRLLIG
jgi:Zn-dependent protease